MTPAFPGGGNGKGGDQTSLLPQSSACALRQDAAHLRPPKSFRPLNSRNSLSKKEGILPFVGDVAKEETAARVVEYAKEKFGRLDILVNNAASIVYQEHYR